MKVIHSFQYIYINISIKKATKATKATKADEFIPLFWLIDIVHNNNFLNIEGFNY